MLGIEKWRISQMNDLIVNGTQNFMGKEIPVVLGGFGEGKKCICDKTIADVHGMETYHVRELINRNIKRFKESIDIIDLKAIVQNDNNIVMGENYNNFISNLGYTQMQISKSEHIYLLSERGYAKLIKIMDTDFAWEIHDRLIDEYFELRENKRKESLEIVNETVKIFTDLMQKAGCSAEIQLLTVKTIIENNTGMILPIMIQADKQYYDTEYIARKVGMYVKSSGKPAEKAVNEIIRRLDISEDMYTETWETNGKWQGTVRKYSDEVIKMVLNWCEENGYPNDIEYIQSDGQKKKYHVKWKEVA